MENPNYYAILTADVRYDKELNFGARLLYAEITALANKTKKCWANNSYFADLYEVDARTIQRWLEQLRDKGHLNIEIKDGFNRIITLGSTTKMSRGVDKNVIGNPDKNVHNNNTSINNKNNNGELVNSQSDEITYEEEFPLKKKSKDNKKEIYNRITNYYVSLVGYTGDARYLLVSIKGMWELCEKKKIQNPEEEIKARIKYAKDYFESKGLDWSLKAVQTHWNKILDYARN